MSRYSLALFWYLCAFCVIQVVVGSQTTITYSTAFCTTNFGSTSVKPVPRTTTASTTRSHVTSFSTTTITVTATPATATTTSTLSQDTTTTVTAPTITDTYTSTSTITSTETTSTTSTISSISTISTTMIITTTSTRQLVCTSMATMAPSGKGMAVAAMPDEAQPPRRVALKPSQFPTAIQCTKQVTLVTITGSTKTSTITVTAATPSTTIITTSTSTTTSTVTPVNASTAITTITMTTTTITSSFSETTYVSTIANTQTQTSSTTVTSTSCATNFMMQATGNPIFDGQFARNFALDPNPNYVGSQYLDLTANVTSGTVFSVDSQMHLNFPGYSADQDPFGQSVYGNPLFFDPPKSIVMNNFARPACSITLAQNIICSETDGRNIFQYCLNATNFQGRNAVVLDEQINSGCYALSFLAIPA